jgi:hypothetical protein
MFQHYTQHHALRHNKKQVTLPSEKQHLDVFDVYTKWPIFMKSAGKKGSAPTPMAHFGSVGNSEKYLEDKAYGVIVQK